MTGYCPRCEKLVAIRVKRVEPSGRYVYAPVSHTGCGGGEIR